MRPVFLSVSVLLLTLADGASSAAATRLIPPVDAPVAARFEEPRSDYGPGHRGVDYAIPVGTRIRASGEGIVTFAGPVAFERAITIDHGSGIETTYTGLGSIDVAVGDAVGEGQRIATAASAHGRGGLHFGVKLDGRYVDPMSLLVEIDVAGAIHLAPLNWTPDQLGSFGEMFPQPSSAGTASRACRQAAALSDPIQPPNDNIAVAVAGITSKTKGGVSADIYESGPELLGYRSRDIYSFSYAGIEGPRLHRPYNRDDTYIDIRVAAARLRALMVRVAARHPGRHVDLLAHSQGGVVARTYLSSADADSRLPVVDHFVTFATPHRGAPGAGQVDPLRHTTLTGRYALAGAKALSEKGLPVPDPDSAAVGQLAPGSDLMESLASEDVAFGTRVLALAIPNDPVVPADHALVVGEQGRIVPPSGGLAGHSAIVTSPDAHGIAYSFLSDRAPTCPTRWDEIGVRAGAVWSGIESSLAPAYRAVERVVLGPLGAGMAAARMHAELVYRSKP